MDDIDDGGRAARIPSIAPPHRVRLPVNLHRWERLAFLHWRYAPETVASLLPPDLTVDPYDGAAWVGVTPFVMRAGPPGLPLSLVGRTFPETNVRTYVIGPDGRQGLWFLRLEAGSASFVRMLRVLGLPYVHQRMEVSAREDGTTYSSRPRGSGGGHTIVVRPGEPVEAGPLERFLTARWRAYHRWGGRLLATPVDHPPWPLRHAESLRSDVDALLRAAGLPPPPHDPLVHASDGVAVRVGRPRRVDAAAGRRSG